MKKEDIVGTSILIAFLIAVVFILERPDPVRILGAFIAGAVVGGIIGLAAIFGGMMK